MSAFTFLFISDVAFFLLALCALFGHRFNGKSYKIAFGSLVLALALLTLVRPLGIGADDYYYVAMAQDAKTLSFSDLMRIYQRDNVYFYALAKCAQLFGVRSLMIIASVVFLIKVYFFSKLVKDKFLALYAYFCLSFFLQEIIQFRASMAIMFTFAALYYLGKTAYLKMLAAGLGAFFSHYSSMAATTLLKVGEIRPIFYYGPIAASILSFFGLATLSPSFFEKILPQIIFISRHLDEENTLYSAQFSSAALILYFTIALSGRNISKNKISAIGLAAVNFSALVVLVFKEVVTFAVRLNEFLLTFYILNIGYYSSRLIDFRKLMLAGALGIYYVRWRWIGVISFNPI